MKTAKIVLHLSLGLFIAFFILCYGVVPISAQVHEAWVDDDLSELTPGETVDGHICGLRPRFDRCHHGATNYIKHGTNRSD